MLINNPHFCILRIGLYTTYISFICHGLMIADNYYNSQQKIVYFVIDDDVRSKECILYVTLSEYLHIFMDGSFSDNVRLYSAKPSTLLNQNLKPKISRVAKGDTIYLHTFQYIDMSQIYNIQYYTLYFNVL